MRFDVKQAIIDRLRATKRENIETVIDYMEKHGFFTYHCHRHHHYDGGLADHAWQTYQIALTRILLYKKISLLLVAFSYFRQLKVSRLLNTLFLQTLHLQ